MGRLTEHQPRGHEYPVEEIRAKRRFIACMLPVEDIQAAIGELEGVPWRKIAVTRGRSYALLTETAAHGVHRRAQDIRRRRIRLRHPCDKRAEAHCLEDLRSRELLVAERRQRRQKPSVVMIRLQWSLLPRPSRCTRSEERRVGN